MFAVNHHIVIICGRCYAQCMFPNFRQSCNLAGLHTVGEVQRHNPTTKGLALGFCLSLRLPSRLGRLVTLADLGRVDRLGMGHVVDESRARQHGMAGEAGHVGIETKLRRLASASS